MQRKVSLKIGVLVLIFSFMMASLTGCSILDKLLSIKDDFAVKDKEQQPEISIEPNDESQATLEPVSTKTVLLFFADVDGKHLVGIERSIEKVEGIARATIAELIQGPGLETGLLPTIPQNVALLDINVREDGLCIVDFSKEMITNLEENAQAEKIAVYSVVNTLTQFPTIDRVEFRVEGKQVETLLGHVQIGEAAVANSSLIK